MDTKGGSGWPETAAGVRGSVVDTVLAQEQERTIDNGRLRHELSKLGITAPEHPPSPALPDSRTSDWFKKWQEKDAKYTARVKTYKEAPHPRDSEETTASGALGEKVGRRSVSDSSTLLRNLCGWDTSLL